MSDVFFIQFDATPLEHLKNWKPIFLEEMLDAMTDVTQDLVTVSRSNMHWKSGDGTLSNSMVGLVNNPLEGQVGSNDPKARRREKGFSGMTDSLGRFYPSDPGAFFLSDAVIQETPNINARFALAVQNTLNRMTP